MDNYRHVEAEDLIMDMYGLDLDVFTMFNGLKPMTVVKSLSNEDARKLRDNPTLRYCVAEHTGDDKVFFYLVCEHTGNEIIMREDLEAYHIEAA